MRSTLALSVVVSALVLTACTTGDDEESRSTTPGRTGTTPASQQSETAPAQAPTGEAPPSEAETSEAETSETLPPATTVPEPTAPDPCTLVTQTDIDAELGKGVGPGASDQLGLFQSCTYATADDAASYFDVNVQIRAVDRNTFEQSVAAEPKTTGIKPIRLDGPGESTYDSAGVLTLWAKGVQITVLATTPEGVDALAVERALATKAVDRLP